MNFFKKWLKGSKKKDVEDKPFKVLGDLMVYDDVLIKNNDGTFFGWVFGIENDKIHVVYTVNSNLEYATFTKERPLNRTEITENNITLITNYDV